MAFALAATLGRSRGRFSAAVGSTGFLKPGCRLGQLLLLDSLIDLTMRDLPSDGPCHEQLC